VEIITRKALVLVSLSVLLLTLLAASTFAATNLTLDAKGRFGCLACHGDQRLVKVKGKEKIDLSINESKYGDSVHKDVGCIECHTDFTFRSHFNVAGSYKKTAGLSCIRCHTKEHQKQYKDYINSVHGRLALSNDPKGGATCGDCHNGTNIHYINKTEESKNEFQFAAEKVCGKCHKKWFTTYDDYYHGVAYKQKAADSPACWDCHGSHKITSKEDHRSAVNKQNLGKTCGVCHPGSEVAFGEQYGKAIHGKAKMYDTNIVRALITKALVYKDNVTTGGSKAYKATTDLIAKVIDFFFPYSLRPEKEAPK